MIDAPRELLEVGGDRMAREKVRQFVLGREVGLRKLTGSVVKVTHDHSMTRQPVHGHANVLQYGEVELGEANPGHQVNHNEI